MWLRVLTGAGLLSRTLLRGSFTLSGDRILNFPHHDSTPYLLTYTASTGRFFKIVFIYYIFEHLFTIWRLLEVQRAFRGGHWERKEGKSSGVLFYRTTFLQSNYFPSQSVSYTV